MHSFQNKKGLPRLGKPFLFYAVNFCKKRKYNTFTAVSLLKSLVCSVL